MKNASLYGACLLSFVILSGCNKDESTTTSTVTTTKPDNTAMNKVDRDSATTKPTDQGENSADIKITADIRRAVVDDSALSTNAHNVKIVTSNGAVTLRGVVDNPTEKTTIETKAKAVAGVSAVDNQLEVKTP